MVDAGFFSRHDALSAEAQSLLYADGALSETQQNLRSVTSAERSAESQRVANQRKQAQRERRIDRCENSWFYGTTALQPQTWVYGGVSAKIARQKAKLEADRASAPSLQSREAALEQTIEDLKAQAQALQGAVARRRALETEAAGMFESAVASAPTPQLHSLGKSAAEWQAALGQEQALAAALVEASRGCAAARQRYYSAINALQRAHQTNQGAQFNNVLDGSEFIEHMQQGHRDQLMQQAQMEAHQAGVVLTRALQSVPPAAAARYPQLAAGIGHVVMPRLEQNGAGTAMMEIFGGDFGDAVAGMQAGGRIQRNIGVLAQCEQLTAQQEARVNALLQAVRQEAANAAATLQRIEADVLAEKRSIFAALRSRCGGVAAVAAAPVATATAVIGSDPKDHMAATAVQAAWQTRVTGRAAAASPPVATAVAPSGPPVATAVAAPAGAFATAVAAPAGVTPVATAVSAPANAVATAVAQPAAGATPPMGQPVY